MSQRMDFRGDWVCAAKSEPGGKKVLCYFTQYASRGKRRAYPIFSKARLFLQQTASSRGRCAAELLVAPNSSPLRGNGIPENTPIRSRTSTRHFPDPAA